MRKLAFGDQKVNYEPGFNEDNLSLKRTPEIEEWAKDIYSFMSDRYREENIIGFYVNLDETAPHIRCTMMPIRDEKFAFKQIFAGSDKYEFSTRMRELHSALAAVNERWGLNRGNAIASDGSTRHVSTDEYRRKLTEWSVNTLSDLKDKQCKIGVLHKQIDIAQHREKGLTTMIENLSAERIQIEVEIAALDKKLTTDKENHEAILRQISRLKEKLTATQQKLADKEEKLRDADHTLAELRDEQASMKSLTEEMLEKIREVIKGAQGADQPCAGWQLFPICQIK